MSEVQIGILCGIFLVGLFGWFILRSSAKREQMWFEVMQMTKKETKELTVKYPQSKFYNFLVYDEQGQQVGTLWAENCVTDHLPQLDELLKYDGAVLKVDKRSIKILQEEIETELAERKRDGN